MQFYEFCPAYTYFRQQRRHSADRLDVRAWMLKVLPTFDRYAVREVIRIGCLWLLDRRPYYSVYPSIAESLTRIMLDVDCSQVRLPLTTMLVRFAVGHPLLVGGRLMQSFLVHSRPEGLELIADCTPHKAKPDTYCATFRLRDGNSVESEIESLLAQEPGLAESPLIIEACARIVVAICMMRQDPELIIPDVLSADAAEFERTGDEKYVDRAHRRGKVGWTVGSRVEISPHSRRAYWGWRWTGPKRSLRQLRPVRGCFVKRRRITEVPTGYLDDEERKVQESSPIGANQQ